MVGNLASRISVRYQAPATLRIRLVGGQRHNTFIALNSADCGYQAQLILGGERYRLKRHISPGGARYLQFVHESLLDASGDPLPCVEGEEFTAAIKHFRGKRPRRKPGSEPQQPIAKGISHWHPTHGTRAEGNRKPPSP